jgi:putative FmdB family regulatory protein
MPTYKYKCINCGNKVEKMESINAPTTQSCNKCEGAIKRVINCEGGIVYKGSGFYKTDYKGK